MIKTLTSTFGFPASATIPAALLVFTLSGLAACAAGGDTVLPQDLHSQLTSNGTADDYMTAALLYQKEAQRLKSKARQLEQKAQAIEPIQDPKGIRRNGLLISAQEARAEASTMEQLYATHRTKAETMMGKRQEE